MKYLEGSADKLRAAERQAKEKKLRKWQNYHHTGPEVIVLILPRLSRCIFRILDVIF